MGFGLLFIGYFMTVLNVPMIGIFGTLIRMAGCAVMFYGLLKLRKYSKGFNLPVIGAVIMLIMSAVLLFVNIDGILYDSLIIQNKTVTDFGKTVIGYIEQGITFLFSSFLLWGMFYIGRETEDKKIIVGSIRNFIFECFYAALYLLSFLPLSGIRSAKQEFAVITWILYFVCIGFNLFLIFSAYARICDEDDVEMNKRTANIPFLNGFIDKFEKRAQEAKEEDIRYKQERRKKRETRKKK